MCHYTCTHACMHAHTQHNWKISEDIILAASDSPSALTTFSCLSCLALSTTNDALCASCWAIKKLIFKNTYEKKQARELIKNVDITELTNLFWLYCSCVLPAKTKICLFYSHKCFLKKWSKKIILKLTIDTSSKIIKKSLALSISCSRTRLLT